MKKLLIFCLAVGFVFAIGGTAQAETINVPGDHSTIQAAISAASAGDTIIVAPGTYVEYTGPEGAGYALTIPLFTYGAGGLTIESSGGAANTIIDCGGAAGGVQMVSNQITFTGFTVKNAWSVINQVSGKGHFLSNLVITDFVNYGLGVYAGDSCTFSNITIHTNDVANSNNRTVKGIDIQEYGSGGNTNNHFEDIIIHDIETTGPSGTSMGIYLEGDNPDTHPTTGNTFNNVDIYGLASEYFNCGVYILDTGYYTGTGHMNPYAIEGTTFSGGSIYGFTENGVDVVSRGFYVKGGCKNLDVTGFEVTGCDEGFYFKGFDCVQAPTFPPTGWVNDDSWAASTGNTWVKPRIGIYAAGVEMGTSTPDDYLIMPQQSISTGDTVSLYARGSFMSESANFKLLVSTSGTNQADFTDTLGTYTVTGFIGDWLSVSEDLSAYDGQDIYIAIYAYEQESGPSAELLIDDVTLPDGTTEGFEGTTTTIGAVDVTVNCNDIHGNTIYGVDNSNGVGTIDATNNWWGDASGPYNLNTNPDGLGDAVSDYVLYDPWISVYYYSSFDPPMDKGAVKVKKNRVLPFKTELFDGTGNPVTDDDISAPPVIQVIFTSTVGCAADVTDDALSAGHGTEGNEFVFDGVKWFYNLKTKNYSAPGTYTVTMVSGDECGYIIDPSPTARFVIE